VERRVQGLHYEEARAATIFPAMTSMSTALSAAKGLARLRSSRTGVGFLPPASSLLAVIENTWDNK
jgi:hypothetical protein